MSSLEPSTLLIGTHIHPASGDAARRQNRAMLQLRDLCAIPPVNLQFADQVNRQDLDGFEMHATLQTDSVRITGQPGIRKPIVSELFTRLAEIAAARGIRYCGFTNSDIVFTPAALQRIEQGDHRAYVLARADYDAGCEDQLRPLIYGTDAFVIEAKWWLANQHRFRPYIVGEGCWDNVYTAQFLCWAGGVLLNREPLIRHEAHPVVWRKSPFGEHNGTLAALDRMYFTRWAIYVDRLQHLRGPAGKLADADAEERLQQEVFHNWRPTTIERLVQWGRVIKLMVQGRVRKLRHPMRPACS